MEVNYLCPLLQVFHMPTSLTFYCDLLGFQIHQRGGEGSSPDWVWLKWGEVDLMLNTAYESAYRPSQADAKSVAAHGDTCLYFGCPDIDGAYKTLKARGLKADPPTVAPYGMKQLYFNDPDGYSICFQWPELTSH